MRAKEFITEQQARRYDFYDPSLPRARAMPNMDQYYEFYRFSIDMAQAGNEDGITNDGSAYPTHDYVATIGYSDADDKIIKKALKKRGYKYNDTSPGKSREQPDTNVTSPVAKFKPTKKSK